MTLEDAAFTMAVGLVGEMMESDNTRYILEEKVDPIFEALKKTNPERYEKEIAVYLGQRKNERQNTS